MLDHMSIRNHEGPGRHCKSRSVSVLCFALGRSFWRFNRLRRTRLWSLRIARVGWFRGSRRRDRYILSQKFTTGRLGVFGRVSYVAGVISAFVDVCPRSVTGATSQENQHRSTERGSIHLKVMLLHGNTGDRNRYLRAIEYLPGLQGSPRIPGARSIFRTSRPPAARTGSARAAAISPTIPAADARCP